MRIPTHIRPLAAIAILLSSACSSGTVVYSSRPAPTPAPVRRLPPIEVTVVRAEAGRLLLQTNRAALYLRGEKAAVWRLACAQGNVHGLPYQVPVTEEFLQALAREGTVQRAMVGSEALPSEQTLLRQLHAELVHGLEMDGVISGFVALGIKPSGGSYSAEDLTFLTALGQMTGVALHNAKVDNVFYNFLDKVGWDGE
jgi:hypothetical protein